MCLIQKSFCSFIHAVTKMALQGVERNKLINNTALFLHLYEVTNPAQKKANILRCLADGADVNAKDANNKDNSPAHVAVQIGHKDILLLLIDRGAILDQTNSAGKTPHDLALEITDTEEIEELLRTLINTKSNKDEHSASAFDPNIKSSVTPYFYEKRTGTSGVRGQLYETKLLTLVLLRVLHDNDLAEFHLGTNVNQIGALDDICLRYHVEGHKKPVIFFLQAKHKDNSEKGKLTVEDFQKETGDFSMLKYFFSYLKIKESFQTNTKDPMFAGDFTDTDYYFILYTPVKDEFSRKRQEIMQNNKLNDIIHTGQGDVFQYGYKDQDIQFLTKRAVSWELEMVAHSFLEIIMSEKNNAEKIMANIFLRRYHVALSREVIQVLPDDSESSDAYTNRYHTGRFRPEFFSSSSNFIVIIREYFYSKISTTHCDKTPFAEEVINVLSEILSEACPVAISKAIGKIVTFNEKCNKLEIIKDKSIQQELKGSNVTESLNNIPLDLHTIKEAVKIKLLSTTFKLPSWFGNLDMTLRGDMSKIQEKLGKLAEKFVALLKRYNDTKFIEINDNIVGPKKFLEKGNVSVNGGIGGAVGNLLVYDQLTKTLRFDTNNKNLPKKAAIFLEELINKGISKTELEDYRINVILCDFPKYSLDEKEYLERQAKDYLDKLWFYTNQANEDAVEHIVRKEISTYYNKVNFASKNSFLFDNHAESIFMQSHDKIQKWWKRSGLVRYLNKTNNFFAQAANLLVFGSTLLVTLNFLYIKKINRFKIEFNRETLSKWEIHKFSKGLLNLVTDANLLTGAKLMQYFEDGNATFLDFDYVLTLSLNDYNDLIKELEFTSIHILLLMCEGSEHVYNNDSMEGLCDKLKEIIVSFGSTIILVTDKNLAKEVKKYSGHKYKSVLDNFNFADLTESSQSTILHETKIYFQGELLPLMTILDQKAWGLIRGGLLSSIFEGKKVEIGFGMWGKHSTGVDWEWVSYPWMYSDGITQRIGAHLVRDETSWNVETLNDVKDNTDPVLVMSTSLKRKQLEFNIFGYLVTNTKEVNRLPWIIRQELSFLNVCEWEEEEPSTMDVITVIKMIMLTNLTNDEEVEKVDLVEIERQIILRNADKYLDRNKPVGLFEIELFIYLYNHNHVVFLFHNNEFGQFLNDTYYNVECIILLIKILKENGKRIWIDYEQMDSSLVVNDDIMLWERQKYETEFGKPYILKGTYEYYLDTNNYG